MNYDYTITLAKFLSRYLGLTGKKLTKLTHETVTSKYPELQVLSKKYVEENPEYLYSGKIIYVSDGKKTMPYLNPFLDDLSDMKPIEVYVAKKEIEVDDNIYNYTEMSEKDLRKLLKRKFNSKRNQNCARKELKNRGIVLKKKYNRNKDGKGDKNERY